MVEARPAGSPAAALTFTGQDVSASLFLSLAPLMERWGAEQLADSMEAMAAVVRSDEGSTLPREGVTVTFYPVADELHDAACAFVEVGRPEVAQAVAGVIVQLAGVPA